jgi:hypothetical protein
MHKKHAKDPLGVCSVFEGEHPTITCPIRFRQDWRIAADAAAFFFADGTNYTSLTEVRLNDRNGKSAGNIDVVLVALDEFGQVMDFGALEVQAVYISGNVSGAFRYYMEDPEQRADMMWSAKNYPRPDYLSSSRKRLAPQLIYKGGILKAWEKKMAVAVQRSFFETLPTLPRVERHLADIAWMVYDLILVEPDNHFDLVLSEIVYTGFRPALTTITTAEPGPIESFLGDLKKRIDRGEILGSPEESETPPDTDPIDNPL